MACCNFLLRMRHVILLIFMPTFCSTQLSQTRKILPVPWITLHTVDLHLPGSNVLRSVASCCRMNFAVRVCVCVCVCERERESGVIHGMCAMLETSMTCIPRGGCKVIPLHSHMQRWHGR